MEVTVEAAHHTQARLAVIAPGVLCDHGRIPIEVRYSLE
jgi:hypothetical protein